MDEIVARLRGLTDAELHRLRMDTIPRLLRERTAEAGREEYAAYCKDYEAQGRTAK